MKISAPWIKIERIRSIERLQECSGIFIEAYNREPWNNEWAPDTAPLILNCYFNTPGFMGWTATSGNRIVGCCLGNSEPYYTGHNFYLREIFVSVGSQKSGIGKALMAAMKKDLEDVGIKTIILFTYQSLFDFYTKSGFSELKDMRMMVYTNNEG